MKPRRHAAHEVDGDALLRLRRDAARQVPAQGVRAHVVEDIVGIDDVALRLRHLLAVPVHDVGQADAVPVRDAVRHQSRDRVERVEPAAGLVDRLADVVGGEAGLEQLPVLERVVELRVGHRPGIEPAVDHLRDAPPGAPGFGVHEGDLVDGGTMEIDVLQAPAAQRLELRDRPDALEVALAVGPHRQRRAPEAFPRERPVDVVGEPVPEPPFADRLRHPVDGAVQLHHAIANPARLDVPRVLRVVDERVAGTPPVRIVVETALGSEHEPAILEVCDEGRIGVLEELAGHRLDLGHEAAVEPDPVHHRQTLRPAQPDVVLAVGRCAVHDAGAVLDGDEVGRPYPADGPVGREVVEQARVAHPFKLGALHTLLDGVADISQHRSDERLGNDEGLVAGGACGASGYGRARLEAGIGRALAGSGGGAHEDVVDIGVHRQRQVRRQGPRGGGPHQERRALLPRHREPDVDRRILDLLVAERDLVRREGGADAGVVGDDLVALVDEALVPDLPKQPPHRLDERVVEGVVGIAHVHPEAHALGHPLPVADVAHHRLAAPARELRHADPGLDLGLVEDAELLLDLVLDRQAVGVPSRLARTVVALHVLEAGEDVLERAGEDVMDSRTPVGGRRPLVPAVQGAAFAAALRLVEHVVLAPRGEHILFDLHAVVAARYVCESHVTSLRCCTTKTTTPREPMETGPQRGSHSIDSRGDGSSARCAGEVAVPPGFTRASRHGPRSVTACPRERGGDDPAR